MSAPSRNLRPAALVGLALASLVSLGCRKLETLKQTCISGDVAACESACDKGIAGEGGCFHAGEAHRQRGALDVGGAEFRRASDYFDRSCKGGFGDGCLYAAQMLEAPYAAGASSAKPDELPKPMPDAVFGERDARLSDACKLGSLDGCRRLGNALIGKSSERARAAYERACRGGSEAAQCLAARAREVDIAEKWRVACTSGSADDCTRLGNLLYAVDPPRAIRLFVSECELRGVAGLTSGVEGFVRDRMRQAREGIPLDEPAAPAETPSPPPVVISSPSVKGQVPVVDIERALSRQQPAVAQCLAPLPGDFSGTVNANLIVDVTGDVFRASVSGAPQKVASCLQTLLEGLAFVAPVSGTAEVNLSFRRPPRPPEADGRQPR
jgi:hypothetical protein